MFTYMLDAERGVTSPWPSHRISSGCRRQPLPQQATLLIMPQGSDRTVNNNTSAASVKSAEHTSNPASRRASVSSEMCPSENKPNMQQTNIQHPTTVMMVPQSYCLPAGATPTNLVRMQDMAQGMPPMQTVYRRLSGPGAQMQATLIPASTMVPAAQTTMVRTSPTMVNSPQSSLAPTTISRTTMVPAGSPMAATTTTMMAPVSAASLMWAPAHAAASTTMVQAHQHMAPAQHISMAAGQPSQLFLVPITPLQLVRTQFTYPGPVPVRTHTPASAGAPSTASKNEDDEAASDAGSINVTSNDVAPTAAMMRTQSMAAGPVSQPMMRLAAHLHSAAYESTPAASEVSSVIRPDSGSGFDKAQARERERLIEDDDCMQIHEGEIVFVCPQHENLKFQYRVHLEKHFLMHKSSKQKVLCHICGKTFTRSDHLNRHAQRHGEVFPCQMCNFSANRASHLYSHWNKIHPHVVVNHSSTDEDNASDCSDTASAPTLQAAMVGKRRRTCSTTQNNSDSGDSRSKRVCPMAQLASTMQRTANNQDDKEKVYPCPTCPSWFKRRAHLERHQIIHTDSKPYVCVVCRRGFNRSDYLRAHLQQQHNDTVVKCECCDEVPSNIGNLIAHYKQCHGRTKASIFKRHVSQTSGSGSGSNATADHVKEEYDGEPDHVKEEYDEEEEEENDGEMY